MLRILVVDDDPDTTQSMACVLRLWGHEAFTAHDGAAAVKAADQFRPDVVLLDLDLGSRPDGYEVARQVRRQAGPQPVILCVSGYGRDEDRRQARAAGCDHYLLKPPDLDELRRLLLAVQDGSPRPA
jgi:two-component system, sensor histidine kinase